MSELNICLLCYINYKSITLLIYVVPFIQTKEASFSKAEFKNNILTDIGATLSLFKI